MTTGCRGGHNTLTRRAVESAVRTKFSQWMSIRQTIARAGNVYAAQKLGGTAFVPAGPSHGNQGGLRPKDHDGSARICRTNGAR